MSVNIQTEKGLVKLSGTNDYNKLLNTPHITDNKSNDLLVSDSSGNIVMAVDAGGITTTGIAANSLSLDGKDVNQKLFELDEHTEDMSMHITHEERVIWHNKSDFNGDYNSLTNKPDLEAIKSYTDTQIGSMVGDTPVAEQITEAVEDIRSNLNADYNTLINKPSISEDRNGELFVVDGNNDIIAKIDADGIHTTDIEIKQGKISDLLDNKIDKENPVASGNVSFGRKEGTEIGSPSVAIGHDVTASSANTTAIGNLASATGEYATAIGYSATASGEQSTSIGVGSVASGVKSTAIGTHNTASGEYATAMGCWTNAPGVAATSLGNASKANGWTALASGIVVTAQGLAQHVFGSYNIPDETLTNEQLAEDYNLRGEYLVIVGNGDENELSNAHTLDWDGNAWFAGDVTIGDERKTLATTEAVDAVQTYIDELIGDSGTVPEQIAQAIAGITPVGIGAASKTHTHSQSEITDFEHEHEIGDITGLADEFAKYQPAGSYAATTHSHSKSDITDFDHGHAMSDITGLSSEFAKYQPAGNYAAEDHTHTYTYTDVGADEKGAADSALKSAKEYTDKQMSDLIGDSGTVPEQITQAIGDITPESIGASASTHNHDDRYAFDDHNHDAKYSDINHNHDEQYADANHGHDEKYATIDHGHNYTYSDVGADKSGAASQALADAKTYADKQLQALKDEGIGSADSATKATQDANGSVIHTTYETKNDASSKLNEAKEYTESKFSALVGDTPVATQITEALANLPTSEHTHSWNDLEDKPFGETENGTKRISNKYLNIIETVAGDTITWDGNTDGLVSDSTGVYFKVSSAVPSRSDFNNGYILKFYDSNFPMEFERDSDWIDSMEEFTADGMFKQGYCMIIPHDNYTWTDHLDNAYVFPEQGTYFISKPLLQTFSFTISEYTGFGTEKIKEEYLSISSSNFDSYEFISTDDIDEICGRITTGSLDDSDVDELMAKLK